MDHVLLPPSDSVVCMYTAIWSLCFLGGRIQLYTYMFSWGCWALVFMGLWAKKIGGDRLLVGF